MILKVVWDSDKNNFGEQLQDMIKDFSDIDLELYDMTTKNRKRGFRVMNICGATSNPFVSVYNPELLRAFYSEDNSCTIENIKLWIKNR